MSEYFCLHHQSESVGGCVGCFKELNKQISELQARNAELKAEAKVRQKISVDNETKILDLEQKLSHVSKEKEAYREVAIKNWKMWCGEYEKATRQDPMKASELKKESESSVDAEAQGILAEQKEDK